MRCVLATSRPFSLAPVLCCAAQVRTLVPGAETVLGDAAADAELFVTDEYEEVGHLLFTAQTLFAFATCCPLCWPACCMIALQCRLCRWIKA